jgi:FkbM family methyltransferase
VWKRLPPPVSVFPVPVNDGAFLYEAGAGDRWARRLYWRGLQDAERYSLSAFARLAPGASVVVDVGAYAGLYTLVACTVNRALRAYAFEPTPVTYGRLARNLELNDLDSRATLYQAAVADVSDMMEFVVPSHVMPPSARLVQAQYRKPPEGRHFTVEAVTLDEAVPEPIDLVKIDVEGAEHLVIKGMAGHLTASRPAVIIESLEGGSNEEVTGMLNQCGYRFLLPCADGLVERASLIPERDPASRNYLCVAPEGFGGGLLS